MATCREILFCTVNTSVTSLLMKKSLQSALSSCASTRLTSIRTVPPFRCTEPLTTSPTPSSRATSLSAVLSR